MRLSVVTCTRNRPALVERAVRSVLANDCPDFEYVVVDQSDSGLTARAVRGAAGGDSRLRYFRHTGRGKSRALNYAVSKAHGDVIAVIDDDCEAQPNWISAVVAEMADGRADVVCGQVLPAPHDADQGYVTGFQPARAILFTRGWYSMQRLGMGSNLAFRRRVLERVGPFDETLGPGASIPAGEDRDFLYRALRKGFSIRVTPMPTVVHHDFRSWAEHDGPNGRAASFATASAYWKHIRRGDVVALWRYLADLAGDTRYTAGRILRRQRPLGVTRLRYLVAGAALSLRESIDPERDVYVGRGRTR